MANRRPDQLAGTVLMIFFLAAALAPASEAIGLPPETAGACAC